MKRNSAGSSGHKPRARGSTPRGVNRDRKGERREKGGKDRDAVWTEWGWLRWWRLAENDTWEQVRCWLRVLDGDRGKWRGGTGDGEGTGLPDDVGFWYRTANRCWRRPERRLLAGQDSWRGGCWDGSPGGCWRLVEQLGRGGCRDRTPDRCWRRPEHCSDGQDIWSEGFWDRVASRCWRLVEHRGAELEVQLWWWHLLLNCGGGCTWRLDRNRESTK